MPERSVAELFTVNSVRQRIQDKLPLLFQMAEVESSRAGRIGMEVGSTRERILIALFIHHFGRDNVYTELPIAEPEADAIVFGRKISIKTITGRRFSGVKIIWTVDAEKAIAFAIDYQPTCDMLLVRIEWNHEGGLYFFPQQAQIEVLETLGVDEYLKLPKPGTNPRGVEITSKAVASLIEHDLALTIPIQWNKSAVEYDLYARWIEFWEKE